MTRRATLTGPVAARTAFRSRQEWALPVLALTVALACSPGADRETRDVGPQDEFWASLGELCGAAFEGEVTESAPEGMDADFEGRQMIVYVRDCGRDVIRIPFQVGEDRSRTWIISRTGDGLRLKHDHRHEDGSPDELTMYGGDTEGEGTATEQAFPADSATAEMLPAAATNVWTLELDPGRTFSYALRREGTDRRFRVSFDLTRPVEPPAGEWW